MPSFFVLLIRGCVIIDEGNLEETIDEYKYIINKWKPKRKTK